MSAQTAIDDRTAETHPRRARCRAGRPHEGSMPNRRAGLARRRRRAALTPCSAPSSAERRSSSRACASEAAHRARPDDPVIAFEISRPRSPRCERLCRCRSQCSSDAMVASDQTMRLRRLRGFAAPRCAATFATAISDYEAVVAGHPRIGKAGTISAMPGGCRRFRRRGRRIAARGRAQPARRADAVEPSRAALIAG